MTIRVAYCSNAKRKNTHAHTQINTYTRAHRHAQTHVYKLRQKSHKQLESTITNKTHLDGAVVVIKVDGSDHLGPFEIADAEINLRNDVTSHQFEYLSRGGESRIHFDASQFQRLQKMQIIV